MSEAARMVPVRGPDGHLYEVPANKLAEVPEGSERLTSQQFEEAKLKQKYNSATDVAGAAAFGALDTLTFGAADAAAIKAAGALDGPQGADQMRQALAENREVHSTAHTAGQIGGAILPKFFSGGAAGAAEVGELGSAARAAGRAATAVPRAIGAVGEGAAALGRGIVGTGAESFLGRVAQRAIPMAAQGAAEGALYGAAGEVSEAALGDTDLTAEKLLAGAKGGALLGGAIGGGLGAAGEVALASRRSLASVLEGGKVSDILAGQAEKQAFKAFEPAPGDYRKLGRTAEEIETRVRRAGRTAIDEGLVSPLDSAEARASKVAEKFEKAGKDIGDAVAKLDTAPVETRARLSDITAKAQEYEQSLRVMPDGSPRPMTSIQRAQAREVRSYISQLEKASEADGSVSFKSLHEIRADLDKQIYKAGPPDPDRPVAALKQVRNIIEDEFQKSADMAAEKLGIDFRTQWAAKKQLYSDLATLSKISSREMAKEAARSAIGLKDIGWGLAGEAALGGPKGLLLGLAHKAIAERGSQIAAHVFDRVGKILQVADATAKVDVQIAGGVKGLLSNAAVVAPASGSARKPVATEYAARSAAITAIAANPAVQMRRATEATSSWADHAPRTAGAVAQTSARAVDHLTRTMPPGHTDPYSLTPQAQRPTVSDSEAAEWLRRYRAVTEPMTVLEDAKRGKATKEAVEALRDVYPKLYGELRTEVARQLVDRKHPLPYAQRIQLGILLDMPTDATLAPDFIQAVQESFLVAPSEQPSPPQSVSVDIAAPYATDAQRAEMK